MKITPITEDLYFSLEIMIKALANCTRKYRYLIGQRKMTNSEKQTPQKRSTEDMYSIEFPMSFRN